VSETQILLADDDDVGRYVIATMLRRAGFAVAETADGAEAVEAALARPPDLVVLDVKMPKLDGFEACRRLKSHQATQHVPVLLLSATFLESEARVEGLDTGADAYLTQPVEAPVLAATIRALLRARSAEAEVRLAAKEWSSTFDAISDAVAVLAPDGSLLRSNRAFEAISGEFGADRPLTDLLRLANGDELRLGARVFRLRTDRLDDEDGPAGRERLVLTLSDITAAQAAEQERAAALATERTISQTLQQSLLPERLPQHPHLELHAWHVAAESELIVGGDWYDVIETEDGMWLVMGDIAGHGVVAAAQAGQLRHSLRVYAHEGYGLVDSLHRLNDLVLNTGLTQMATLCVVALDAEASTARYALAGHPPPLVVPIDGPARFVDGAPGPVLGVVGAVYTEWHVELARGDRLVLYTDGLVERPREAIDNGLERMRRASENAEGLEALRLHLVQELCGVADLRDDVALLLARHV
jgi:serine phosphatase RsbU (regulator of sigma subunit)/CheY-like chemotaxis protein